jgi:hypothetical protein
VPAANEKIDYYRRRCLECHRQNPCHLPEVKRLVKSPEDNCVRCHMPRVSSSDVAHNSITDHRVLAPGRPTVPRRGHSPSVAGPLLSFHQDRVEIDVLEASRDRGIALTRSPLIDLGRPTENAEARHLLEHVEKVADRRGSLVRLG